MSMNLIALLYLVASVCFIQALKGLSHPTTSIRGNLFGMIGMTIAVLTTVGLIHGQAQTLDVSFTNGLAWVLGALVVGGGAGTIMAKRVEMTKMPELVAFMHSMIGLAAVFIAVAAVAEPWAFAITAKGGAIPGGNRVELALGAFIGAVTFTGSVIAFGKLSGKYKFRLFQGAPVTFAGQHMVNLAVGLAIGFSVRLVFAAVELAGEIIGLQMGLNFASFFDPSSNAQISAVARFFGHMAMLLFVVINGHLLILMAVVKSFDRFPVDGNFLQALGQMRLYELGSSLFASALWIALPMIALLLFVNLTLGIISRVAPQMNIYAVGFPVTLTVGMLGIVATLPLLEQPVLALMQQAVDLFAAQR